MKKLYGMVMAVLLLAVCMTGCGSGSGKDTGDSGQGAGSSGTTAQTDASEGSDNLSGKHHVKIKVKGYGTISVELDADTAPISVTNFVSLAKSGFYDGLTFHRIISGFMIQGGDPKGDGTGGSEQNIIGEFADNGVENNLKHVRGTISMARSADYDSASSQFFIMHQDAPSLDGQYAAFGTVTDGMEVVDKICEDTPVVDDNGTVESDSQPVIQTIKVID